MNLVNLHCERRSSIFPAYYHAIFQIASKNYSDYSEKTIPTTVSDNGSSIQAIIDDAYRNFLAHFIHIYIRISYVGSVA